MNDSKISVRYAKALFQTAMEKNLTEEVMQDMRLLGESLLNPGFQRDPGKPCHQNIPEKRPDEPGFSNLK